MSKKINIALFGFGRIGRNIFRLGYSNPNLNFVAISDLGHAEVLHYLLMRDSIHGTLDDQIKVDGNYLISEDQNIRILSGGKPGTIPWDTFDVDFVIDATGKYLNKEELEQHLHSGAKRVLVTNMKRKIV